MFRSSEAPPRPSRASALVVRVAPGDPKGRLGAPREPPRTPKDGPKRSQDPLRMPLRPPLERFHEIHVKKDPSRPPRCPPRCPWRSPSASNILWEHVFPLIFTRIAMLLLVCLLESRLNASAHPLVYSILIKYIEVDANFKTRGRSVVPPPGAIQYVSAAPC